MQGEFGFLVDDLLGVRDVDSVSPIPALGMNTEKPYFQALVPLKAGSKSSSSVPAKSFGLLVDVDALTGETSSSVPDWSSFRADPVLEGFSANAAQRKGQLMLFDLPHCDGESHIVSLALSVTQVLEITRYQSPKAIPCPAPHMLGYLSWRDRFVPVLDVCRAIGLTPTPPEELHRPVVIKTPSNELLAFFCGQEYPTSVAAHRSFPGRNCRHFGSPVRSSDLCYATPNSGFPGPFRRPVTGDQSTRHLLWLDLNSTPGLKITLVDNAYRASRPGLFRGAVTES